MGVLTTDTYMAITFYFALLFLVSQAWSVTSLPAGQMDHEVKAESAKFFRQVSLDYLTWQQAGSIKTSTGKSPLIITNQGVCAGGALGFDHITYRTFIDGCFVYASGNAGAVKNSVVTYDQSDISAYGAKMSLGIGRFVSSARAEIGFKIPIMYIDQKLTLPSGTKLTEPNPLSAMASLYSRWPFEKWFVQTEFSKFIGNDLVLFSLGGGHEF